MPNAAARRAALDAEVRRLNERKGAPGDAWRDAEVIGEHTAPTFGFGNYRFAAKDPTIREPSKDAAAWAGWGTALKPAWKPIVVARKPLVGTIAENVLAHGCGGLNIAACRVGLGEGRATGGARRKAAGWGMAESDDRPVGAKWPANVVTDSSDEVLEAFAAFGERAGTFGNPRPKVGRAVSSNLDGVSRGGMKTGFNDTGTAARFFYGGKAGARDRVIHCTACGARAWATDREAHRHGRANLSHLRSHPTVKSQALMTYLCRMVCPPGSTIFDLFAGSGSTGQAALAAGFNALLIEREADYINDIRFRLGLLASESGIRQAVTP